MILYVFLGLVVLFFSLKIGLMMNYRFTLKRMFKSELISYQEVVLNAVTYKIQFISCSKHTQVRINSYAYIELLTPRHHKQQLIPVNLKHPTLIITSSIQTKLRVVINENEERFFDYQDKIYASYIVPIDKLASFKESLHD